MESAFEFQARQAIGAAKNLAHAVKMTQAERLEWEPKCGEESSTRSVLDQVVECVRVNRRIASWLAGDFGELSEPAPIGDADEAQVQLMASAQTLSDTIRVLDNDVLDREIETAWGPMKGRVLMTIPVANMYYHMGQINFIQRLYGDAEDHFTD